MGGEGILVCGKSGVAMVDGPEAATCTTGKTGGMGVEDGRSLSLRSGMEIAGGGMCTAVWLATAVSFSGFVAGEMGNLPG
jgi:hypothetical protein